MNVIILDGKKETDKENVFKLIEKEIGLSVSEGLQAREAVSSTGFEHGIAIPHTKVVGLKEAMIVAVNNLATDWPSMDGNKIEMAITILVPESDDSSHLTILSNLSRKLVDEKFITQLKEMDQNQLSETINNLVTIKEGNQKVDEKAKNIVAVTGCTTGIAHTFMAAENIEKKALELGYNVKVETRGQGGVGNELTSLDIQNADFVIIASDVEIPMARFSGKKLIKRKVKDGVHHPEELIKAVQNSSIYESNKKSESQEDKTSIYAALMNGVTHMLPFTIAGGIFTALRFFFGTPDDIAKGVEPVIQNLQIGTFSGNLGGLLFAMMLPVLAAYIAYAKGNRAGLMPGALAGLLAANNGSGFLGAIVGGFVAGYLANIAFKQMSKLTKSLQGSYQILFMPLLLAVGTGLFMEFFGIPIAWLNSALSNGLMDLQNSNPLLLGAIIGGMMAADMGGPINKAAYVTGTLLLAEGNQTFMAAVMAGGMVPPLSIALSTILHKKMYTKEEQQAGISNWILGFSFITEGAIPFAAADPKKVIPAIVIGSGVSGSLTMLFGITLPAPHGGIFVFPLVNHPLLYFIAIAIGSLVGALCLFVFKKGVK